MQKLSLRKIIIRITKGYRLEKKKKNHHLLLFLIKSLVAILTR